MTLSFDTLTHLWLEIAPETQHECWRQSQTLSTPAGRWTAYLHQLCLNTFLPWCQAEEDPVVLAEPTTTPELWEMVSGLAITFGKKRLILMPSDAIDIQELRVPQEWVDIPAWAGDYYLAVQVNPDEGWLRIWGYTTHQRLKAAGQFDSGDRTYTLERDDLISDLNVLWVVQQLNRAEPTRDQLPPLPLLTLEQANPLLDQIDLLATTSLRLTFPFAQWGPLLADQQLRSQLFSRIGHQVSNPIADPSANPIAVVERSLQPLAAASLTDLSRWFQNVFQSGWLALDEMLEPESSLAYGFRKDAIAGEMRRVKLLSFADPQATESSTNLAATDLAATDLAIEASANAPTLALLLSLNREDDGRVEIRAQVRPAPGQTHLPANLVLELLTIAEQPLQTVRSRRQDNYIQLKRFKCLPGWQFTLKIKFNGVEIREGFMS